MNWTAFIVFLVLFALVTVLGFYAVRWMRGDLSLLDEWGLAGRRFGPLILWFLLGGDLYTAYTFIAVPGQVYGQGAIGFFAVPYTIIVYPFVFLVMPRLWNVAKAHGYVTTADFVRDRYGSQGLGLAVAFTGILATMPYIALQLVGMEVVLKAMGLSGDIPIIVAFLILAAYTYTSGLRAPAMIALVKDVLIYITVIVAIIVIPARLGGFAHIFAAAQAALSHAKTPASVVLPPKLGFAFATLSLGSALALFLYPHSVTGVLSSQNATVVRRNAAFLPAYSFILGLIALFGYMALAAGVRLPATSSSLAVPELFLKMFPSWFAGFAFAAIAIGALVPASIMSIGAANLFTRNVYKAYFAPQASAEAESRTARIVSLLVKLGALAFVLFLPVTFSIQFQLLGGVWILQTLPSVILGLYTRYLHRTALLVGWAVGMVLGTWMAAAESFKTSVFPVHIGSLTVAGYAAVWAVAANLLVALVLTVILRAAQVEAGADATRTEEVAEEVAG